MLPCFWEAQSPLLGCPLTRIRCSLLAEEVGLLVLLGLSTRAVDSARRLNLDISSSALVVAVALLAPVDPNTKGMVSAGLVDI